MKKNIFIVLIAVTIFAISCTPSIRLTDSSGSDVDFEIAIPSAQPGAKAPATTFTEGDTAWVRAFDSSRNRLAIGGSGVYSVTLTWTSGKWRGSVDLSAVNGPTTFLAVVLNASTQVAFKGSQTIDISDSNRNTAISLAAATSFSAVSGDIGPAGGWVYYDKGSYSDGWRYLEASPGDLSLDWTSDYIDTSTHVVTNGDVYLIGSPMTPVLTKYHFYWGPAGDTSTEPDYTFLTEADAGAGQSNTFSRLDAVSSATPKLKTNNGRKSVPLDETTNVRRDTPDTLKTWNKNGLVDWFIPSKDELDAIYTQIGASGGFTSTNYWSSTEDLTSLYYTDEDPSEAVLAIPNAYAKHFGTGTGVDMQRDTPSRVRPSRRF